MVGHPRDPHVRDRHEAEHRRHHQQEEGKRKQGVVAPARRKHRLAVLPHPPHAGPDHWPREKHPGLGRIDLPAGIDRQQVHRPHDRREIVEDRHPGDRHPRGEAAHGKQVADDDLFLADRAAPLIRDRHDPEHDRDREQGQGEDHVLLCHLPALPPGIEERDHGERHDRRLGEHREQEKHDRARVEPLPLGLIGLLVLAHPAEAGEQEEGQRERVFRLRHPRHALHAHGMHHEHERREPRPGDPHLGQQSPEQKRACDVQKDRGDVVAGGAEAEEGPLGPKGGVGEREVVGAVGVEPQLGERAQAVGRHVRVGGHTVLHRHVLGEQLVVVPEPVAVI